MGARGSGGPPRWEELRGAVRGRLSTEEAALAAVARDASPGSGRAGGRLRPLSTEDVVAAVRWARADRVPVLARGSGTSLEGGAVPPEGALVVDLSAWDDVLAIDPEERTCRVRPGLINFDLQRRLAEHGLFFPPNPGSWRTSSVGGNVATNASGPRSLRYGSTRRWVRGFEAVLGTGEVLRAERHARKSSVGPDLVGMFVGSEGTLGVFTELTLDLAPRPEVVHALAAPIPVGLSLQQVAVGLDRAIARGLPLSAVEFLDRTVAEELAGVSRGRLPAGSSLLLLELESRTVHAVSDLEELAGVLASLGLGEAAEFPNSQELWTLRGEAGTVLDRTLGPRVREDVAVPLARLDELFALIERVARAAGVRVLVYGHLGEGNLHPNFLLDPGGAAAAHLVEALLDGTRSLGGTISAEHGIGSLKAPYLLGELGATGVAQVRALRRAFDPDGILNPGKLLPD